MRIFSFPKLCTSKQKPKTRAQHHKIWNSLDAWRVIFIHKIARTRVESFAVWTYTLARTHTRAADRSHNLRSNNIVRYIFQSTVKCSRAHTRLLFKIRYFIILFYSAARARTYVVFYGWRLWWPRAVAAACRNGVHCITRTNGRTCQNHTQTQTRARKCAPKKQTLNECGAG